MTEKICGTQSEPTQTASKSKYGMVSTPSALLGTGIPLCNGVGVNVLYWAEVGTVTRLEQVGNMRKLRQHSSHQLRCASPAFWAMNPNSRGMQTVNTSKKLGTVRDEIIAKLVTTRGRMGKFVRYEPGHYIAHRIRPSQVSRLGPSIRM